jgi:hypothetical protein
MLRGAEMPEWMWAGAPVDVASTQPQELAALKMRAEQLGRSLENIQRRIKEVEADPTET